MTVATRHPDQSDDLATAAKQLAVGLLRYDGVDEEAVLEIAGLSNLVSLEDELERKGFSDAADAVAEFFDNNGATWLDFWLEADYRPSLWDGVKHTPRLTRRG